MFYVAKRTENMVPKLSTASDYKDELVKDVESLLE